MNDFFLLHGVTAAWSLKQVLSLSFDESFKLAVIRLFLCGHLALYMTQGKPVVCAGRIRTRVGLGWNEILDKTFKLQVDKTDEHIYKLVQVCKDMSKLKDRGMDEVYKAASMTAIEAPFVYGEYISFRNYDK